MTIQDRLLKLLKDHQNKLLTWNEIKKEIPELFPRMYTFKVIAKLRKHHVIQSQNGNGYIYQGELRE